MKKTRIIAPALAIIAFSTAASIAGSVAWFTASRQVTINAGNYAVVKTNSNLTYTMANGVGTTTNAAGNTVTFTGKLTHGSFSHTQGKVYTPAGDGKSIAKETALTANNFADEMLVTTLTVNEQSVPVYTAATFNITFTMNFGQGEKDKGLFLNNTAEQSSFTVSNSASPVTAKGFRMAFYPAAASTDGVAKVFADLQESSKCKFVNGTTSSDMDGTAYTAGHLIDKDYNAALPDSQTTRETAIARADYLGLFRAPAANADPKVSLTYTVVAWYEGTDENIVNRDLASDYQEVITKLVFDAVDLNPAA